LKTVVTGEAPSGEDTEKSASNPTEAGEKTIVSDTSRSTEEPEAEVRTVVDLPAETSDDALTKTTKPRCRPRVMFDRDLELVAEYDPRESFEFGADRVTDFLEYSCLAEREWLKAKTYAMDAKGRSTIHRRTRHAKYVMYVDAYRKAKALADRAHEDARAKLLELRFNHSDLAEILKSKIERAYNRLGNRSLDF
jgi:hypothetical protein